MQRFRAVMARVAVFAAVAAPQSGCGPAGDGLPREPVSGRVSLDDGPLARGLIQFVPVSGDAGATHVGAIIQDGRYAIPREEGPVPGTYRVAITGGSAAAAPAEELPGVGKAPPRDAIPPQYNLKTTLEASVRAGAENTFDFVLSSR